MPAFSTRTVTTHIVDIAMPDVIQPKHHTVSIDDAIEVNLIMGHDALGRPVQQRVRLSPRSIDALAHTISLTR